MRQIHNNSTVKNTWVFVRNTVCVLSLILVILSPFQNKNERTASYKPNKNIYFSSEKGDNESIMGRDGTIIIIHNMK